MTKAEIEKVISEHNERAIRERNERLRARLACPRSSEELILLIGGLADNMPRRREGRIPLTNCSAQYIM